MIYLFCGILGGAVLGAICIPLFRKEETLESAIIEETEWDLLQRKKEVVLGNIQDLDFEYKCGKLSEEDYQKDPRGNERRSRHGLSGYRNHRVRSRS